jgi:putative hydrolase of the HAD superfamily
VDRSRVSGSAHPFVAKPGVRGAGHALYGAGAARTLVGMSGRQFSGMILDFAGVLTSNMVEVIGLFEQRERLDAGTFLKGWADSRGQELYRRLEVGDIDQRGWNVGFGALLGVNPDGLMGPVLHDLDPAYELIRVAREARAAGVRTAVLSNSLGREPYDPYAPYDLRGVFDVVVFSADLGIRKPDPEIFRYTLDLLGVAAHSCVFADDTEANLVPAHAMGMTVIHALDERETALRLRGLLGLPGAGSVGGLQKVANRAGAATGREFGAQSGERRG